MLNESIRFGEIIIFIINIARFSHLPLQFRRLLFEESFVDFLDILVSLLGLSLIFPVQIQ